MKIAAFAFAATIGGIALSALIAPRPAYAQWVNDGCTYTISQAPAPSGTVFDDSFLTKTAGDEELITTRQYGSGDIPPNYASYQLVTFVQRFHWSGTGTPTTSFTVPGSGTLSGTVSAVAPGAGDVQSIVNYSTGRSTWQYSVDGAYGKFPSGNIAVSASGTTASFTWWLSTRAWGWATTISSEEPGSYDCSAEANYTIGAPNP